MLNKRNKSETMRLIKHLGVALIAASVLSSCNDNSANQQNANDFDSAPQENQIQQQDPVQTPGTVSAPVTGEADKYGRMPGDAHYGHDHPTDQDNPNTNINNPVQQPQTTMPAGTTPGGKDKYGRSPGDAHYGHDHPIQPDENISAPAIQTSPIKVQ